MKLVSNINIANVNNLPKKNKKQNNNSLPVYKIGFGNNLKEDSIELKDKKKKRDKIIGLSTIPVVAGALVLGLAAYGKKHLNKSKNEIKSLVEEQIQRPFDVDSKDVQKIFGAPRNKRSGAAGNEIISDAKRISLPFYKMNLDEKRKNIIDFWSLPDSSDRILYQKDNYILYAYNNKIFKKDDEEIITKFKTPGDNPKTLNIQCFFAQAAIRLGILTNNKGNKELITNLLKTPSEDPDALSSQCQLAQIGLSSKILTKNKGNKELITNLLKTPSDDPRALCRQCYLAQMALNKNILNNDNSDKKLITNLLKTPSDDPRALCSQGYLAQMALNKNILNNNNSDKELITNLLKTPSKNPEALYSQYQLTLNAVNVKILDREDEITKNLINAEDNNKRTQSPLQAQTSDAKRVQQSSSFDKMNLDEKRKYIIDFWSKPNNNSQILEEKINLGTYARNNKIFKKDDEDILTQLQTPSDNKDIFQKQCNLAEAALQLHILIKSKKNKELIINYLKQPSDDPKILKSQCELGEAASLSLLKVANDDNNELKFLDNSDTNQESLKSYNHDYIARLMINLLDKPCEDPNTIEKQFTLAKIAMNNKVIGIEDKDLVLNLLNNLGSRPGTLNLQCQLATVAINNKILNSLDKEIVLNLLDASNLGNDNSTLRTQINLAQTAMSNNVLRNDYRDKEIIKNFSNHISSKPEILNMQYQMIDCAINYKILNGDDKEFIVNLLNKRTTDPNIIEKQCQLAISAINYKILKNEDEDIKIVKNLLNKKTTYPNIIGKQCQLAALAINNKILSSKNKGIIESLLNTPCDGPNIIGQKCQLAISVLNNKDLKIKNLSFIEDLLKAENKDPYDLGNQCKLASLAIIRKDDNEITKNIIEDKEIIKKLLQTPIPKQNYIALESQYLLAMNAVNHKVIDINDKDLMLKFCLLKDLTRKNTTYRNYLIANLINKKILDKSDTNDIIGFIQPPSEDELILKSQCDLAISLLNNNIIEGYSIKPNIMNKYFRTINYAAAARNDVIRENDCNIIKELLQTQPIIRQTIFSKYKLALAAINNKILDPKYDAKLIKDLYMYSDFDEPNLQFQFDLLNIAIDNHTLNINYKNKEAKNDKDDKDDKEVKKDRDYKEIIQEYLNLSITNFIVKKKQLNFVIKLIENQLVNINDTSVVVFIDRLANNQNVPPDIKELQDRLIQLRSQNGIV